MGIVGETSVDAPLSFLRYSPLVVSGIAAIGNYHLFYKPYFFVMSPNFAEFLLENADTGTEVLAVLDHIVEVVETGGTDL